MRTRPRKRVLFVCLGNICRSPAAEGVFRRLLEEKGATDKWDVDSAGLGNWHTGDQPDGRMRAHARARGLELNHVCRQTRRYDFARFDFLVAMDDQNYQALVKLAPNPKGVKKILKMGDFIANPYYDHVPDPYYEGSEGFELVLDLLEQSCQALYDHLVEITQKKKRPTRKPKKQSPDSDASAPQSQPDNP